MLKMKWKRNVENEIEVKICELQAEGIKYFNITRDVRIS